MEKVSVFSKIRVLFWPEISALGVFLNFDNERMRPPKYPSAPPGFKLLCGGSFYIVAMNIGMPYSSYWGAAGHHI